MDLATKPRTGIWECSQMVSDFAIVTARGDMLAMVQAGMKLKLAEQILACLEDGRQYAVRILDWQTYDPPDPNSFAAGLKIYKLRAWIALTHATTATVGEHVILENFAVEADGKPLRIIYQGSRRYERHQYGWQYTGTDELYPIDTDSQS